MVKETAGGGAWDGEEQVALREPQVVGWGFLQAAAGQSVAPSFTGFGGPNPSAILTLLFPYFPYPDKFF